MEPQRSCGQSQGQTLRESKSPTKKIFQVYVFPILIINIFCMKQFTMGK